MEWSKLVRVRSWGAVLVLVLGSGSCSESPGSSPTEVAAVGVPQRHGSQVIAGHYTSEMSRALLPDRVDATRSLTVTLGLPSRDPDGFANTAAAVSDPANALYGRFLTLAEVAEQFGASATDYQKMVDWAQGQGFSVETHPSRLVAQLTGPVATHEKAFHVRLKRGIRRDGTEFYGPDQEPSVDLEVPILHISNLDNYVLPAHASSGGSGYSGLIVGKDLRLAYASCTPLNGDGQTIGILSLGGDVQLADISHYLSSTRISGVPALQFNGTNGTADYNLEDTLDAEMAMSMAPAAQVIEFRGAVDQALSNMAAHTEIKQLSSSWFTAISQNSVNLFLTMQTTGQSFFEASGDDGAYGNNSLGTTGTSIRIQPVTMVGGTELNMNAPGRSYASETAWSLSGGGILSPSVIVGGASVPLPAYQIGLANASNSASSVYRNVPDVSMVASGVQAYFNGQWTPTAGTSIAAPLWAGFAALANQQRTSTNFAAGIGLANPVLYKIASKSTYTTYFNDVTSGNNSTYNATAGYDLVTGLGSPTCSLAAELGNPLDYNSDDLSPGSAPGIDNRGYRVLDVFRASPTLAGGSKISRKSFSDATSWTVWKDLPPLPSGTLVTDPPSAVSWDRARRIDVFVHDRISGQVLHAWSSDSGQTWAGWENLGLVASAIGVSSWGASRLDLFASDSSGHLLHLWHDTRWGHWEQLLGITNVSGAPAAVSWGVNRIDAVYRTMSGTIGHVWWDGSTRTWSVEDLGGWIDPDMQPAISSRAANELNLFWISSGAIRYKYFNNGWFLSTVLRASTVYNGLLSVQGGVSATSWDSNRIDIVAGGNFQDMWHSYATSGSAGSNFSSWESPGPGHN